MFKIIAKLSLKMKRNDLILPMAVSHLHETVANIEALNMLEYEYASAYWIQG